MLSIETRHYTFTCQPENGTFDLLPSRPDLPALRGARLSACFRAPAGVFRALESSWPLVSADPAVVRDPHHGRLQTLVLRLQPEPHGLVFTITFALPEEAPLFFWKLSVENCGTSAVLVDCFTLLKAAIPQELSLAPSSAPADLAFFASGWQSWSYTASYRAGERQRPTRLGPFQAPMTINASSPQPDHRNLFRSDFYALLADREHNAAAVLGFLSQREQFGTVEAWLGQQPYLRLYAAGDDARLDPGASMTTDWAVCALARLDADPLAFYLDAAARENNVRLPDEIPVGWCSWYHFYTKVTEADIRHNLQALVDLKDELPVDLLQIDDGYETIVGDWFTFKPTFPSGMRALAEEIKAAGLTPGIWQAPFIVHPKSRLAREHPDWLLRTASGRPANAGFVWNALCYALDLTNPEAMRYAEQTVAAAVQEWGYPYLKLDFLYAAALKGRYQDPTKTRAQVLRRGMERLRAAAGPDTFILACGAPLGSVLGLVEANRIGADVSGSWKPAFFGIKWPFREEPNIPCASLSIHNILTRAHLHRRWWLNDPDCLLVRPDTELTLAEVHSLATAIALTGGYLLLSDDLPRLPTERVEIARALFPSIDRRPQVLDWLDAETPSRLRLDLEGPAGRWTLAALFNWADRPAQVALNPADFGLSGAQTLYHSFWDGQAGVISAQQPLTLTLPAHGVLLAALRPFIPSLPQIAGSRLHVSQGSEITAVEYTRETVEISLSLPRRAAGDLCLSLPRPPLEACLDGVSVPWRALGGSLYAFPLAFTGQARLVVRV